MKPLDAKDATEIEVEVVNVSDAPMRENDDNESAAPKRPWSKLGEQFTARPLLQRVLISLALILSLGFLIVAALIFAAIALIAFILRRLKRLLAP